MLFDRVLEFLLLGYCVLELEEEGTLPPCELLGEVLEFVLFGVCELELEGAIIGTFPPYVLF